MRRVYGAVLSLALGLAAAVGAQPTPTGKQHVLPQPAEPTVSPSVKVGDPVPLRLDEIYVINSPVDAIPRFHPNRHVKVSAEKGPIRVRARFAGGNGKTETREFAGPFVWFVEPTSKGLVAVDVFPKAGVKEEKDIPTGLIDVLPDGKVEPKPEPAPEPKPAPTASFRVMFVYESEALLTRTQKSTIYAQEVSEYLDANCTKENTQPGWRRREKDADGSQDQPVMAALWAAVKPKITSVPCVVVEVNGKADILPLPGTPAEAITLFKKYKGG